MEKTTTTEPRKRGRPTCYTAELVAEICERLALGESLRSICRDDHVPTDACVRQWALEDRDGFYSRYAKARDLGLDAMADEIMDIADDGRNDWIEKQRKDGSSYIALDTEAVMRSRLRFDARRWYLSKLAPKRYGEKITQEITNPDGSLNQLSEDQIAERLLKIQRAAQARREASHDDGSDLV